MDEAAARWVRRLPWRWATGGGLLGLIWIAVSVGLTSGFSSPFGHTGLALLRVGSLIVIPLASIGGIWGLSERRALTRAAAGGTLDLAIRQFLPRQVGKAMLCGLVFGIFLLGSGLVPRPWTNVTANLSTIAGLALLAVPIGALVGLVSGRALKRRLARGGGAAAVF